MRKERTKNERQVGRKRGRNKLRGKEEWRETIKGNEEVRKDGLEEACRGGGRREEGEW